MDTSGRLGLRLTEGDYAARRRGVNRTIFGGLLATGPGEIRLCCGENCSENPDDAANRAGLASEIDQDDADHARHDGSVHQVLPRNRRGGPQGPTEDDRAEEHTPELQTQPPLGCRLLLPKK